MIDFLIHVTMGIAIGAYLFNANVRTGVNNAIMRLFSVLMDYLKNGSTKKHSTAKRSTSAPKQEKQETVGYKTTDTVKSLYRAKGACDKCGAPIVVLEEGVFKGSGICTKCNAFVAAVK